MIKLEIIDGTAGHPQPDLSALAERVRAMATEPAFTEGQLATIRRLIELPDSPITVYERFQRVVSGLKITFC